MKIRFNVDSGANINSNNSSGWMSTETIGYSGEEWKKLTEDQKSEEVQSWADNHLSIYYEESE